MPSQLGDDINSNLMSLALQKRAAAQQGGGVQAVGMPAMVNPQDNPASYASDYVPSPKAAPSPSMSASGGDNTAATLKKRREKFAPDAPDQGAGGNFSATE